MLCEISPQTHLCELVVEPLGAGLSWRKWVTGGLTDLQGYSLALTPFGFLLSDLPTGEQAQAALVTTPSLL